MGLIVPTLLLAQLLFGRVRCAHQSEEPEDVDEVFPSFLSPPVRPIPGHKPSRPAPILAGGVGQGHPPAMPIPHHPPAIPPRPHHKARGGREFLSIMSRLEKTGVPQIVPPGAWCSGTRMTASTPISRNPLTTGGSTGGFSNEPGCGANFAEDFYGPGRHALLASAQYEACGVRKIVSERYTYYTHTLRVPGAENNAVVTCACPLSSSSLTRRRELGNNDLMALPIGDGRGGCMPTTKWEHKTTALQVFEGKKHLPAMVKAVAQGHIVSASMIGGPGYTTAVTNDEDGMVFEAVVFGGGEHLWPWPMGCHALCPDNEEGGNCLTHLIVDGCPVRDDLLDFKVLKHNSGAAKSPAEIAFKIRSLVFQHYDRFKIKCVMATFPNRPTLTQMCEWSRKMPTRVNAPDHNLKMTFPRVNPLELPIIPYSPGLLSSLNFDKKRTKRPAPVPPPGVIPRQATTHRSLMDNTDSIGYAQNLMDNGASNEEISQFINNIPPEDRGALIGSLAASGGDVSQLDMFLDQVPEEDREAVSAALLAAAFIGTNTMRYQPVSERAIQQVSNTIVYDNYAVNWGRDHTSRASNVYVQDEDGYVGLGGGLDGRETSIDVGYKKAAVSVYTNEDDIEGGVGVYYGDYGVRVDRDFDERQTSVDVIARGVESGTVVDFADREYGQRIKVRDTEIMVKHDFDDTQDATYGDDDELATEIVVGYKTTRVAVGMDVNDTEYAVSVGTLGRQFSILRDFDERETELQANWGDGYQLVLNGDFPDDKSEEIFGEVGFGKKGALYAQVGAGVGADGIPQGSAEIETADVGIGIEYLDDDGTREMNYKVAVGKFTYVWESEVIPDNILIPDIPAIIGIDPIGIPGGTSV